MIVLEKIVHLYEHLYIFLEFVRCYMKKSISFILLNL